MGDTVLTIGHSNRSLEEFLGLVREHGIDCIVDVRAHPGSRRLPQFGQDALADALGDVGVEYRHAPGLGGRRRFDPQAPGDWGGAWRNRSFGAYAQYAQSSEYDDALRELIELAHGRRIAIMCSEAVPWRCHRWLVSDTLVAHGLRVHHVLGPGAPRLHAISSFSMRDGDRVTWPGPESSAPLAMGPALVR